MGDAANHVNTVIDFNDVPGEPQLVLGAGDSQANLGYFFIAPSIRASPGRISSCGCSMMAWLGRGLLPRNFPTAAQWDNIAITPLNRFQPPAALGTGANVRPIVSITNPVNHATLQLSNSAAPVIIQTSALDLDGSITNVSFFADGSKLGEAVAPPWSFGASNLPSGTYSLTAVASDNLGATTLSRSRGGHADRSGSACNPSDRPGGQQCNALVAHWE